MRETAKGGEAPGLPLYLQVSATLRTAILRGIYPVGSRLPTEDELCRRFGVSRHTIREAVRRLREEDLITSRPGSRPLVASPTRTRPIERVGEEIGEDFFDYTIGTRLEVRSMEMTAMTEELAAEAGQSPGEQWLRVEGYRTSVDTGATTCWNSYHIARRYAAVGQLLARQVGPFIPLLEDLFGKRITRISRSVSAVPMPDEHAERFAVAAGSSILAIVTLCQTADRQTAMVNRSLHPGATLRYAIDR